MSVKTGLAFLGGMLTLTAGCGIFLGGFLVGAVCATDESEFGKRLRAGVRKGLDEAKSEQTKVTIVNGTKQNPIGFFDGGTGSDTSTSNGLSDAVSHESA